MPVSEPAVGAVVGDTGVGATCGAIGAVGGIPPAPGGISPASTWWEKSAGIMLGGAMPWNPAAFSAPEAGPGVMPTLDGLNIGEGAKVDGPAPYTPLFAWICGTALFPTS